MSLDSAQGSFENDYKNYRVQVLQPTYDDLKNVFREWRNPGYWEENIQELRLTTPTPIQRTRARIKRSSDVVKKIKRNTDFYRDGLQVNSVKKMPDAVGGRVIVYFLSQLPLIDKEIRKSEHLEVSEKVPPKAYLAPDLVESLGFTDLEIGKKDSGYASIHYRVRLRTTSVANENRPWFELQVRTLAEDLWGELEHVLGYKPAMETSFKAKKEFRIIASQLRALDEHFNLLDEEFFRCQKEIHFADADPLTDGNLRAVFSRLSIGCDQKETESLLNVLRSGGIKTVGDLLTFGEGRVEQIKEIYMKLRDRLPKNYEIISALSVSHSLKAVDEIQKAVAAQIESFKVLKAFGATSKD